MAHQAPLSMGFPGQDSWNELPFPAPGDLPDPGTEPVSPAWQADSLPLRHQGSLRLPVTKQVKGIKNLLASAAF